MLRLLVVLLGLVLVLIGALLIALHVAPLVVAIYFVIDGGLIAGAVLLERSRYRPPIDRQRGWWQETGERFVDPTTHHLIEVRQNAFTGERDYVDRGPAPDEDVRRDT